jgi:hypothetical protein
LVKREVRTRNRAAAVRLIACAVLACAALLTGAAPSGAYTFGPTVERTGPEQMLFDWTTQKCQNDDIPDLAARAFRDSTGRTQLITTHYVNHRYRGWDLNGVRHECPTLIPSGNNSDPAAYNDKQWLTSPYTIDGRTVYAMMHVEYRGGTWSGRCPNGADKRTCVWYSIAFARSTDGGNSYVRYAAPSDLVATLSYPYSGGTGPAGYFQPSNIVYRPDGYFYMLVGTVPYGAQQQGACLVRTRTLAQPWSWRAWDGAGFNVRFIDPYVETSEPPESHVCTPVGQGSLTEQMTTSLTYNTYFGKYIVLGGMTSPLTNESGFYYSLSDDLIHWSTPQLLMKGELMWTYKCDPAGPVQYPSLIYPGSPSRNYTITGQEGYLYYTHFNYAFSGSGCNLTLDRDLIRVPIRFTSGQGTTPPPNCFAVKASPGTVTTPNNRWIPVHLSDSAHSLSIEVTGVTQDEPNDGIPTARYADVPDQVRLRAASDPDGDGRVYRVWFIATGGTGSTCWGKVKVRVERNGKGIEQVWSNYDSLLNSS